MTGHRSPLDLSSTRHVRRSNSAHGGSQRKRQQTYWGPYVGLAQDVARWGHRRIGMRHPRRFAAMIGVTTWAVLSIATYHAYPGLVFGAARIALSGIASLFYLRRNPSPSRKRRQPRLSDELLAVKDALIESAQQLHERATALHSQAAGMVTRALADGPLSETTARFLHMHVGHVAAARQEAADLLRLSTLIGTDSDATAALLATTKVTGHLDEITRGSRPQQPADDQADEDRAGAAEADVDHEADPTQDTLVLDQILADPRAGARPLGYR